jgi:hypothetical protein
MCKRLCTRRGCNLPLLTNQASRLLGGGRLAAPVPALSAEIITNGGFDVDANWTKEAGWTIGSGVATRDGTASTTRLLQTLTLTVGTWYQSQITVTAITAGSFRSFFGFTGSEGKDRTTPGTYVDVYRAGGTSAGIRSPSGNGSVDNISFKAITLASMFSTRPYSTHTTTKAMATVAAGTQAGVVANLDSATSPANAVLASHDGTTARLTKLVAGVYTELVSQAVAYVPDAYVEIRRAAGTNNFALYYNGSAVGAAQTVNDATVIDNVLCGLFNTFSGNSLTGFSCVPSA